MNLPRIKKLTSWDWILIPVFLINVLIIEGCHKIEVAAAGSVDSSNLREICQSTLIYAQGHNDQLPSASDIWDYARILAESDGLEGASFWQSKADPATPHKKGPYITVLNQPPVSPRRLNPAFRQIKPSFAVAIGNLTTKMPPTTPVIWTRGLQVDGKWSSNSPYGGKKGYINFISGYTMSFEDLKADDGQLERFDGKGKTSNILEALPPGTSIGEYHPSPEDDAEWWRIRLWRHYGGAHTTDIPFLFWCPFILCLLYRLLRKKRDIPTVLRTVAIIIGLQGLLMWATY